MYKLPDGSGFFVASIGGPREKGIGNFCKYTRRNNARRWLLIYRNYKSAMELSRLPDLGPPVTRIYALAYSLDVSLPSWCGNTNFMGLCKRWMYARGEK